MVVCNKDGRHGAGHFLRDGKAVARLAKTAFHGGYYRVRLGEDSIRSANNALDDGDQALDAGGDPFRIKEPALRR